MSATSKLILKPEAAFASARLEMAKRLLAAAIAFQAEHRKRLNVANPPPHDNSSRPGQYPKKRTGFGQSQVSYEPTSPAEVARELVVRVGISRPGFYLEVLALDRGRKGLIDTLNEMRGRLEGIINSGGGGR